ncbi:hypothetical protein NUW54_g3966 [Trametes sanguinea]|uniref:Uncharacterized protein n=1 Tax=Trametes sanguinea TaxID=158606 RepID=A0ACC1Q2E1_9APHY|nr:hypothetical protein NUW54_g3966 [Trametes sanguinea]
MGSTNNGTLRRGKAFVYSDLAPLFLSPHIPPYPASWPIVDQPTLPLGQPSTISSMVSLKARLLAAERDFVSALIEGGGSLVAFNDRWEQLLRDVDTALETNCLDHELSALAHATATRIAALADLSEEAYASCELVSAQLVGQLEVMVSDLTLHDNDSLSLDKESTPPLALTIPRVSATPSLRKRRRTSSPEDEDVNHSAKRYRTSSLSSASEETPESGPAKPTDPGTPTSPPLVLNRKRRFSDSEPVIDAPPQKRRFIGPRLHAVSDSFISPTRSTCTATAPRTTSLVDGLPEYPPIAQLVDTPTESSDHTDRESSSPNNDSTRLEICNALADLDDVSLTLPGLDSLDAFLETIFHTHDSIFHPPSISDRLTLSSPSHDMHQACLTGAKHLPSQSSPSSSDSDSGSSPASSMPSSPRSVPTTPSLDAEILKFDLGASQCFPIDDWSIGAEYQLNPFDAIPPVPETKWPYSPISSSWLDVSRLISPSLDGDFESLS